MSCTVCGAATDAAPAAYHPFAYCVLVKAEGSRSADVNLAAVIEAARSEDPSTQARVDQFLARVQKENRG